VVGLSKKGKSKTKYVHRLMLEAFVPVPDKYKDLDMSNIVSDHIDNDSSNNTLSNLQWLSRAENSLKNVCKSRRPVKIVELNVIFNSQIQLAKFLQKSGLAKNKNIFGIMANVRRMLKGDSKSAYGFTYEYVKGDE
jgi:hypothetical protein